LIFR